MGREREGGDAKGGPASEAEQQAKQGRLANVANMSQTDHLNSYSEYIT